MKSMAIVSILALAACGNADSDETTDTDDAGEECTTGLPTATVDVTLTGAASQGGAFEIVCGINTESPWGLLTRHLPDGMGVPPFTDIVIQSDLDWAFSARYATVDLEVGMSSGVVRGPDEPGPPLGHGYFAEPVETDGYQWDLTAGALDITESELIEGTPLGDVTLITGTFTADFGGPSPVSAAVEFTDLPIITP